MPPAPGTDLPLVRVAAGVLRNPAGRVLIARRPDGAHAGGFWEFPGGKIRPDETPGGGLARELAEELGIQVKRADPLLTYQHPYPDRVIELHVWVITEWGGVPRGVEGQPLRWLDPAELRDAGILPADLPIIEALLTPP